jgi:hypothetical protein
MGSTAPPDWTKPESFNPWWNGRADAALALITGRRIADIGCGAPQYLRSILPEGVEYLPADLTVWTPDTEECDLGAGRFPERALARCDTVVVLGVLEYLTDVPAALRGLSAAPAIVFSYRFGARNASDATLRDLRHVLRAMGFRITRRTRFQSNTIIRAVRGWSMWGEILRSRLDKRRRRIRKALMRGLARD